MKTSVRFCRAVGFVMLCLACPALAQIQEFHKTPAQPYLWQNVVIGGGGFVTGIIFHPHQKGLVYTRTDVGGAYRWDVTLKKWIPITDWLSGIDFTGIESIALDPNDTNRIYLAAGIYRSTHAAILRSDDQGRSWKTTAVPFQMGGNETGRFNGERLTVDPHEGSILFFGSRHDGLWKSLDYGVTWCGVPNFPAIDSSEGPGSFTRTNINLRFRGNFVPQQTGIVFIEFDPRSSTDGKPTPILYAGVSTPGTNLFFSHDYGQHWQPVPGQPVGLRPNHAELASDGTIFLTYGKEPGPSSMSAGAVWKYSPASGLWNNITPGTTLDDGQSFGYGAVSVDPENPSNVLVTTFAHWHPHDEIFRSTNGGTSWFPLLESAQWDYSLAPYTRSLTPHWMGTIRIDPFDPDRVLFTTGYGIWASHDLRMGDAGHPTHWEFMDAGLEETVPVALISPPIGAHLLTGTEDIDGFRHDDLNHSPAEGSFRGPRFTRTDDLAFAGRNPTVVVRIGSGGKTASHVAISADGGNNWNLLAGDPEGAWSGGSIAISADARAIVWSGLRRAPSFTTNNGVSWSICGGLESGLHVIADPVDPDRFYAFAFSVGKLFISTNGAANFFETSDVLPTNQDLKVGTLYAAPGLESDLWLTTSDGIFHSTDAKKFEKLKMVQSASSLGFGKAAPDRNSPTLYLSGKIETVQGVFRSDDDGENWTLINDNHHQYGAISHMTGDPRIYGRVYFATSGRGVIYGDPAKNAPIQ